MPVLSPQSSLLLSQASYFEKQKETIYGLIITCTVTENVTLGYPAFEARKNTTDDGHDEVEQKPS